MELRVQPAVVLTHNEKELLGRLCETHTSVLTLMHSFVIDNTYYNRSSDRQQPPHTDTRTRLSMACDLLHMFTEAGMIPTSLTLDLGRNIPVVVTHSDALLLGRCVARMQDVTHFAVRGNFDTTGSDLQGDSFDSCFNSLADRWTAPTHLRQSLKITSDNLFEFATTEAKARLFSVAASNQLVNVHINCKTSLGLQSFVSSVTSPDNPTPEGNRTHSSLFVAFNGNHGAIRRLLRHHCLFSNVTISDMSVRPWISEDNHMRMWKAVKYGTIQSVTLLFTHDNYGPNAAVAGVARDMLDQNYHLKQFVGGRDGLGSEANELLTICTTLNRAQRILLKNPPTKGAKRKRQAGAAATRQHPAAQVLTNLVSMTGVAPTVMTGSIFWVLRQHPDVIQMLANALDTA